MKTKLLFLLLFISTFAIGQTTTTPVGSLKINNELTNNDVATKVLVINPTTKLVESVLKSSIKDVLEFNSAVNLPVIGLAGKVYITKDNNKIYRWTGTIYQELAVTDITGKVDKNNPITAATKTKITYDSKGLVTSGADATTADISDSSNKRYVTDANLVKIQAINQAVSSAEKDSWNAKQPAGDYATNTNVTNGLATKVDKVTGSSLIADTSITRLANTSGTNTGDQTTITGNAGTATVLQTTRLINEVGFNGSSNITINAVDATPRIASSEKGVTVATLVDGKIPNAQIPALAISETFPVTSQAEMLNLPLAEQGDIAIRSDVSKAFILRQTPSSTLGNWSELLTPASTVTSVAGKVGAVVLNSVDVGLGNVPNTDFTSAVLANTAKVTNATHTGDVTGSTALTLATVNSNVGTFNNVTINAKGLATAGSNVAYAPLASPSFTSVPTAPTATAGTNTTQLATTAFVTTANNLKANIASPALTGVPTAPTATIGTNTAQLATTAFVTSAFSSASNNYNITRASNGTNGFSVYGGNSSLTNGLLDIVFDRGQGIRLSSSAYVSGGSGRGILMQWNSASLAVPLDLELAGVRTFMLTKEGAVTALSFARTGGLSTDALMANGTVKAIGNIDNTSDVNKPISTATQTALDGKLNLSGGNLNGSISLPSTGALPNLRFNFLNSFANSRNWFVGNDLFQYGSFGIATETAQNNNTLLSRFQIDATGNIGINTTTPTEKLDVVGNGKFSSNSGDVSINLTAAGDNSGLISYKRGLGRIRIGVGGSTNIADFIDGGGLEVTGNGKFSGSLKTNEKLEIGKNIKSKDYIISVPTTSWVKLYRMSGVGNSTLKYVSTSENSEESGEVDIHTMYYADQTSINVKKNTYNSKVVEVRVAGIDGAYKDVYVKLITDGYSTNFYWSVETDNIDQTFSIVNTASVNAPAETLFSTVLLNENKGNFFNNNIIGLGNGKFSGTVTASPATLSTQLVTKGQLDAVTSRPYKVYTALISQSGTNAPVATVLENTLGGTVVWSRTSTGIYLGTLTGVFLLNKVTVFNTNGTFQQSFQGGRSSDNAVVVNTTNFSGTLNDGLISGNSIEIRVYN